MKKRSEGVFGVLFFVFLFLVFPGGVRSLLEDAAPNYAAGRQ